VKDDKLQPGSRIPVPVEQATDEPVSPVVDTGQLVLSQTHPSTRWLQLAVGIIAMVAVTNFQYAWTLFVLPLDQQHGWGREAIQVAFSIFLMAQTLPVPLEAYLADRFGPRLLVAAAGILVASAWAINATTNSLGMLYVAQALSGGGSGIVYGISMGSALKWFPDRRGLAAGLTAAAFGAGSAATVVPIEWTITHLGYQEAFLWFGLAQGLVVTLAGLLMRFPEPGKVQVTVPVHVLQTRRDYRPAEVVASPAFWLLYVMMTAGAIPGLLMTGQMAPMANDFGVAKTEVTLLGITYAALPFALMLDRVMGGLTRPVFGWISDRIGRELSIFLAFALEGTSLYFLIRFAHDPVVFVVVSGISFFGWGAVFSLFPAVSGDMFGRKYATTNYALLYTAKGLASLVLLLANRMRAETGNWVAVFVVMIAADWVAALLALLVLRPLRRKLLAVDRDSDPDRSGSES
jgi:OFA family oxalate/formate antiporter-like MFS transporter